MGLRLTVLGSAAAWSEARCRPSSSYLVECDGEALILDLGQGALSTLFAHRDPSSVTAIAVSHMHTDHHVDLVPLRNLLAYGYDERRQVGLHLPGGLRERYDVFLGETGFLDDLPGADLDAGIRPIGPFLLQAHPVRHSLNSFAFRVSRKADPMGPGLVYSGDCGHAEDLLPLIRPGDTLLCEAFWSTREPIAAAMHLTAAQAGDVASTGGAARLVLTHVLDAHDPQAAVSTARLVFRGPVDLAVPDLAVEVPGDSAPPAK